MSILRSLILPLSALIASLPLAALTVNTGAIDNKAIFGIEFQDDARAFHGREANIQSISKQEYITASFRVTEVNIVTNGSALLRIYHSRPLKAGELQAALSGGMDASGLATGSSIIKTPMPAGVKAITDRGTAVIDATTSNIVIKDYPIATHARTIEFRLSSRAELIELHDELKKHWLKEPAFFESGQIVDEDEATSTEMQPRSLGGTIFRVEG